MPLFRAMAATWPAAEVRAQGPWTIRDGRGAGKRASAATLDGPAGDPAEAAAAMLAMGQRPLFLVRSGQGELDSALERLGYAAVDPVVILAAPAAPLAPAAPDETAILCDGALACMAEIWEAGGIGAARRAVMERAPPPKRWLLGRDGDRPAAAGFVARDGAIAFLHALHVAPFAQRRGLGARLTRAAAGWARDAGATTLALAVTEANAPARALYAELGLVEAARYHYRVAPEGDRR